MGAVRDLGAPLTRLLWLLLALLTAAPVGATPRVMLGSAGPVWLGTITPTTHPRIRNGRSLLMVNPDTGGLHLEQVDLMLTGYDPQLELRRIWDDTGWRTSLDDKLVETTQGVEIHLLEEILRVDAEALLTTENPMIVQGPATWPLGAKFTGEAFTAERLQDEWLVERGPLTERYDKDGWLLERKMPGNTLTFERELGLVTRVETSDGRSFKVFQDTSGHLSMVQAPEGFEIYYDYQDDQLKAVSNSHQGRTRYTYDDSGLIASVIWPDGTAARIRRDAMDRVSLIAGPGPLLQSYQWDDGGFSMQDGAGNTLRVNRKERGENGYSEAVTDGTGKTIRTERRDGLLTGWTDPQGATWRLQRDGELPTQLAGGSGSWYFSWASGALTGVTAPSGGRWSYERDDMGRAEAVVDPAGRRTAWARDSKGQIVGVSAGGAEVRLQRNIQGRVTRVTSPGGGVTDIQRDALGRVTKVLDPSGHEILLSDHRGHQAGKLTNRDKHSWSMQFDALGRPTRLEAPSGEAMSLRRSTLGRIEFAGVAFGAGKRYSYRPDGRLTGVKDALGASTGLIYDASGRLAAVRRPDLSELRLDRSASGELSAVHSGETTLNIERDSMGHPTSVGPLSWSWDLNGNLTSVKAPGVDIALTRSSDGAVNKVALGETEVVLERDGAGRVVKIVSAAQTLSMPRNADGLVSKLQIDQNLPLTIDRDTRGLVVSMSEALRVWRVLRDGEGYALKWTSPDGTSLSGPRDAEGRPELVRYPDGALAKHTWDLTEDSWSLEDSSGRPLMTRQIEKDFAGRPTRVVINGQYTVHVRHDPTGQLVALESDEGTWSRTGSLISGDGMVVALEHGQPSEASPPRGMEAWGVAYESLSYLRDELGRVTALLGDSEDAILGYDPAGRLTTVLAGDDLWQVEWDLLGRPMAIRDPDGEWLILQFGPDGLISWRSELEGLVDVLHADGWGWMLSGDLPRLLIPDETGAPRAFGYDTYEPLSWTPMGFPERYWSAPIGWMGGLTLFGGGPYLDGGGAWDPVSGGWVDRPNLLPWAATELPTGEWPGVDETATPWWDPEPYMPETIWSDPLALMVALGELEPVVDGDWLTVGDGPAALPWLPAASATPAAPLCPPTGALPIALPDSPLTQLAVRSSLTPTKPIDTDAVINALADWEFSELTPLLIMGPDPDAQRPWLPPAALLR